MPSSAIVVPLTWAPALRSATGSLTSGVHCVGREHVRLVVDAVGDERANRRLGLESAVCPVVDLDRRRVESLAAERERNGDQPRGKLFIGQTGDEDAAIGESQVGDRLGPLPFVGAGSIGELGLGETDILERHVFELAVRMDSDQYRGRVGPAPARNGDINISRQRIDRQVVDRDLLGIGSQHGGDFSGQVFDLDGMLLGGRSAVPRVDREKGRPLGIPDEEDPLRPKRQGPGRLQVGRPFFQARRGLGPQRHRGRRAHSQERDHQVAKSDSRHFRFSFVVEPIGFHRCHNNVHRKSHYRRAARGINESPRNLSPNSFGRHESWTSVLAFKATCVDI